MTYSDEVKILSRTCPVFFTRFVLNALANVTT